MKRHLFPVSIVITHFKQQVFLFNLLNYLLKNNWCNALEVIVIDDCSMTESDFEKLKVGFPDVLFAQTPVNGGPSAARNLGVSHSKGDYIQFIDADDWILPEKIQIQYESASKNGFPTIVFSKWAKVTNDSTPENFKILDTLNPIISDPLLSTFIRSGNFIQIASSMLRRDCFTAVNGFNETMWLIEDVNLQLRIIHQCPSIAFVDSINPLFFYRSNLENSLSKRNEVEFISNCWINYNLAADLTPSSTFYSNKNFREVCWTIFMSVTINDVIKIKNEVISEIQKFDAFMGKPIKPRHHQIAYQFGYNIFYSMYRLFLKMKSILKFRVIP